MSNLDQSGITGFHSWLTPVSTVMFIRTICTILYLVTAIMFWYTSITVHLISSCKKKNILKFDISLFEITDLFLWIKLAIFPGKKCCYETKKKKHKTGKAQRHTKKLTPPLNHCTPSIQYMKL